jgi:hypothetical protein
MGVGRQAILAGLAVLAGAALVSCTAEQARPRHGKSPATSDGPVVIAHGWIDGRAWRITVDPGTGRLCAGEAGLPHRCTGLRGLERGPGPAALSGAEVAVRLRHTWGSAGPPIWNALYGTVRPDVTLIVMRMSGGREVSLRPVAAAGKRWVGLVLRPGGPDVARVIAYSGRTELGYSVPFYGGELRPGTYFVTWLRPGQRGPARAGRYIATGGSGGHSWDALVLAGPWGYCVSLDTGIDGSRQVCYPPSALRSGVGVILQVGSRSAIPRWIIGTASPPVAYLRLTLADHATLRAPVTVISRQKFYAIEIGAHIIHWGAYNAAGRELYSGNGPPDAVVQQHS